jgi:exosortase/archaeosortase family protein
VARRVTAPREPGVLGDTALLKLAARFLVCFAVLFAVTVWLNMRTSLVTDMEVATAGAATTLMNLTGVVATRVDTIINVPGRQLVIGPDCTGLTIIAMLTALVVAYPVKPSSRAIGVMAGVLAVLVANLVRLVAVAHLASASDLVFNAAHDFLFQIGMVAVAIAIWAAWLSFARARES